MRVPGPSVWYFEHGNGSGARTRDRREGTHHTHITKASETGKWGPGFQSLGHGPTPKNTGPRQRLGSRLVLMLTKGSGAGKHLAQMQTSTADLGLCTAGVT